MPSIEVSDLHKTFGETRALSGISFSVEPGEVVGFLGPNGAGKTTTMKILTGFITQTSGSARIGGLDNIADSIAVRRMIGYLPENAPVYQDMLVSDYLRFVCDVRAVERSARAGRIDEVVEQVGLGAVFKRPIGQLSKGYRQRVGLAQALVHDPEILVLDEPTTGLDPNQIVEIRDLIREIGTRKTVLLSTHILPEVQAVCGRVLIVNQGQIVGFGTPAELEAQARGGAVVYVVARGQGDLEALVGGLPTVARVASAAGEGKGTQGLRVTASGGDVREDIFRALVDGGWTLLEMRSEGGNLEETFRALTSA